MFVNPIKRKGNSNDNSSLILWDQELDKLRYLLEHPNYYSSTEDEDLTLSQLPPPVLGVNNTGIDDIQLPYVHFLKSGSRFISENDLSLNYYSLPVLQSLLLSPRISHNTVENARGLLLSYISNDSNEKHIWNDAISKTCCGSHDDNSESITTHSQNLASATQQIPQFNLVPGFPRWLLPVLFLYCSFALYKDLFFTDTRCIRSKQGLVIAYIVQMALALFSSATIVSLIYPEFSAAVLWQFAVLPLIVIMGGVENTLRLVNAVGRTGAQVSPLARVSSAAESSVPGSIKMVIINCLILLTVRLNANFDNKNALNSVFLFTALGQIIDLVLHVTYFNAVLSVDLHRLELDDLLSSTDDDDDDDDDDSPAIHIHPVARRIESTRRGAYRKLKGLRLRAFLYLNYINPRQRFPIVMTVLVTLYIWMASAGYLGSKAAQLVIFSPDRTQLFINPITAQTPTPVNMLIYDPIVLSYDDKLNCFHYSPVLSTAATIIGGYSVYVILEFVASLTIILSFSILTLKLLMPRKDYGQYAKELLSSAQQGKFSSKDLVGCHTLDVIQIVSNRSWIATVSMDHGICIWKVNNDNAAPSNSVPTATLGTVQREFSKSKTHSNVNDINDNPLAPLSIVEVNGVDGSCKFMSLSDDIWPVSKVVLNGPAGILAIISSRNSRIESWDFAQNKILYSIHDEALFGPSMPLALSFFLGRSLVLVTKSGSFLQVSAEKSGSIDIICPDLSFGRDVKLVAATLLVTPKINEKVVCLFSDNSVLVATHGANCRFNFRLLELSESFSAATVTINNGSGVFSEGEKGQNSSVISGNVNNGSHNNDNNNNNPMGFRSFLKDNTVPYRPHGSYPPITLPNSSPGSGFVPPCTRPLVLQDKACDLVPVPSLHMVLLTTELTASLFDVHTGVVVRHFHLGLYKVGTLRVYHAQPTHCRFCGCVSIGSFSIAYTDLEDKGRVICHTVKIENRAKNNICLRVERDPRETRCLGFEAGIERFHWIDNVEGWDGTDINMMMGVRRKERTRSSNFSKTRSTGLDSTTTRRRGSNSVFDDDSDSNDDEDSNGGVPFYRSTTSAIRRLSGRLTKNGGHKNDGKNARHSSFKLQKKPPLNITWEGWAMNGKGEVTYYDIPDIAGNPGSYSIPFLSEPGGINQPPRTSSRLLIRTVGPVAKYGSKSISVAFGNIIKILYFGNEEFHDEPAYGSRGGSRSNSTISGFAVAGAKRWKREVAY